MKIEIPNTKSGDALSLVRDCWYARYWINSKNTRKSLQTDNYDIAVKQRNVFFANLVAEGATVKKRMASIDKIAKKPDLFVYQRDPFYVVVNGKSVGSAKTRKEARAIRDAYMGRGNHE